MAEMAENRFRPAKTFEDEEKCVASAIPKLGSITSRSSGKEPALLPRRHGWTREDPFVSLSQSDNCPQIFVGHELSRQRTMWNCY